jgi:hypothetical protein
VVLVAWQHSRVTEYKQSAASFGEFECEYSVIGKRGKPLPRWKASVRVYDLRHTFAAT